MLVLPRWPVRAAGAPSGAPVAMPAYLDVREMRVAEWEALMQQMRVEALRPESSQPVPPPRPLQSVLR